MSLREALQCLAPLFEAVVLVVSINSSSVRSPRASDYGGPIDGVNDRIESYSD